MRARVNKHGNLEITVYSDIEEFAVNNFKNNRCSSWNIDVKRPYKKSSFSSEQATKTTKDVKQENKTIIIMSTKKES